MQSYLPGLLLAALITALAKALSVVVPSVGLVLAALLLGIVAGNLLLNLDRFRQGLKFSEKQVLEWAIVLLGFGFEMHHLTGLTTDLLLMIIGVVIAVIVLSLLFGKLFKLRKELSVLLGAGNAICGSAAIAAAAPIVDAKEEEIGLSLGVSNLLGTLGLLLMPLVVMLFDLKDFDASILIGGSLQSIGHVAASSFSMSSEIGEWAMVVKMGRVILLVPFLLLLFALGKEKSGSKIRFPWFVLLFILAIYISSKDWVDEAVTGTLAQAGDYLLALSMAAIGVGIKIKPLLKMSGPGIIVGTVVFAVQVSLLLLYLHFGQ